MSLLSAYFQHAVRRNGSHSCARTHVLALINNASCDYLLPHLWSPHSSGVSAPPSKNTLPKSDSLTCPHAPPPPPPPLVFFSVQLDLFPDPVALSSSLPLLCTCSLTPPPPPGKSVPRCASRRASSSWRRLPLLNDFSPLSDLSLFPPPPLSLWFFRRLALPSHRYSSSCATAPSTHPEPLVEESAASLCANFLHPP